MPRPVADDLILPDLDTAQTVRVGYSNPFEDHEAMFHVRIAAPPDPTPTAIRAVAEPEPPIAIDPAELITGREPDGWPSGLVTAPMVRSTLRSAIAFGLLLCAVSLLSISLGVWMSR
jgi:hypothetical protein